MKPANQDQTVYLFSINNLEKTGQNVKQQRIDEFVKFFVLCCWGVLRCGGSVVFVCCCATLTGAVLLWRWKEKQAAHCLKLPGKTRLRLSKVHATMPWPAPHATCTLRIFAQFFWLIGLVLSVLFFSRKIFTQVTWQRKTGTDLLHPAKRKWTCWIWHLSPKKTVDSHVRLSWALPSTDWSPRWDVLFEFEQWKKMFGLCSSKHAFLKVPPGVSNRLGDFWWMYWYKSFGWNL